MAARERLIQAWGNALDEDKLMGQKAYRMYHDAMRCWAAFYGFGFVQTVEAFVALSPNNDYHGNLRSLSSVMWSAAMGVPSADVSISTYKACGVRAYSYLTGESSFLDMVKGPKIRAFRDNILYPETSKRVTVDGHMIAVWSGQDLTMRQGLKVLRGAKYAAIERDFQWLSRRQAHPVPVVQATLWFARKRQKGIRFSEQRSLFSGATAWDEDPTPDRYPPFDLKAWRAWQTSRT